MYSTQSGALGLSIHTKIYAFADRFNIPVLKDEAYIKASQSLEALEGYPRPNDDDIARVAGVFLYAFANLPAKTDPLLKVYAQYTAWYLEVLRKKECFLDLLEDNSDIAWAVLQCARRASRPPWRIVTQHALLRNCLLCLQSKIADVICPGCLKRAPGETSYISGDREEYAVCLGSEEDKGTPCCSKGKGTYWMHENLICSNTEGSCKGTGANGDLSYPD